MFGCCTIRSRSLITILSARRYFGSAGLGPIRFRGYKGEHHQHLKHPKDRKAMADIMVPASTAEPREINGVPLYTRSGKMRERFGEQDRLRMLGGFETELETFMRVFAPRRSPYIYRRKGGSWYTVHHALGRDEVVKHLLANRLPGTTPVWVGARAWKRTLHAAIDVDFRGDREDFERRCKLAERVLLRLGISRRRMLVCPTPSGGRHYHIFFRRPVFTDQLPVLFEMAGLPLAAGQFEVFPSETKGIRLPFGFIPGKVHDCMAWVRFIRAYDRREFPRVSWDRMVKRATNSMQRKAAAASPPKASSRFAPQAILGVQSRPVLLGSPKHLQGPTGSRQLRSTVPRSKRTPVPMVRSAFSRADIEKAWEQGIVKSGTRVLLTKAIAWHLIFVERLPSSAVSRMLVEWAYRTGRTTSKDVQLDLMSGTRKVEHQIHQIVQWYGAQRTANGSQPRRLFAKQELEHIIKVVGALPDAIQPIRARFILDFLNFAKKMGSKSEKGYECKPSVDGVIKKWENCRSAANYKPHLDWALEAGLLVLVKEKSQRAHRPRTYAVIVPSVSYEGWALGYQEALDYIQEALAAGPVSFIEEPSHSVGDGYRRIAFLETREVRDQPGDRCRERIEVISDSPIFKPRRARTTATGADHARNSDASFVSMLSSSCQGTVTNGTAEYQYQGSTAGSMAGGSSTGPGRGQTLQGLDDRPAGRLPALSEATIHGTSFAIYEPDRTCSGRTNEGLAASQGECHNLRPVPSGVRHRPVGHQPVSEPFLSGTSPALGNGEAVRGVVAETSEPRSLIAAIQNAHRFLRQSPSASVSSIRPMASRGPLLAHGRKYGFRSIPCPLLDRPPPIQRFLADSTIPEHLKGLVRAPPNPLTESARRNRFPVRRPLRSQCANRFRHHSVRNLGE